MTSLTQARFAALMAPLGPFEPAPRIAVAVSGGADSLALAWLARDWARGRGGLAEALVVDHGLRAESAAEARMTVQRLAAMGVPARLLRLEGLVRGPGLAARAREARHRVLRAACAEAGILHLLLGHHAADQAETLLLRLLKASGPAGMAGMAALVETAEVRLLRPLLAVSPRDLRDTLRAAGLGWVEDPSNADPAATRVRLRLLRADRDGDGPATRALGAVARAHGGARAAQDAAEAREMAARVRLHPEGYAVLTPGPVAPGVLAAVLRMLSGRAHAPAPRAVAALARNPRPATLGGVRILPAGRFGPPGAWLLLREAAAMQAPVPAGALWDGRFRLLGDAAGEGVTLGALGDAPLPAPAASGFAGPAALRRTLPALRRNANLFAVPHIGYPAAAWSARIGLRPPGPACPAPFVPAVEPSRRAEG